MRGAELIAKRFRRLNFHDDTLVDLRVLPAHHHKKRLRGRSAKSIVELTFNRYRENKSRLIRFHRCSNFRVVLDFDVLADNLPPNTSYVGADTNKTRMRRLMKAQAADWDVTYSPKSSSPLPGKLRVVGELVFFRVQFFGGVVDIIARRYEVKTANSRWKGP